jgi:WD40 repeat protein
VSEALKTAADATSPYKGLTHFTEDDLALFFGRSHERDVIVANLKARRLTVLYGPSGVGKSSLLRAGVVRALRDEARRDFEDDEVGRPQYVPAIVGSWSDDPLQTLVDGLVAVVSPFARGSVLRPSSARLDVAIDELAGQADTRLLVILDQLEEYFLYRGDEAGTATLAEQLPRALTRSQLPANFLLSIREDALARLDRYKGDVPEVFQTALAIGPLDRDAGRQAILGPLHAFTGPGPRDAEPALVEAVLDQVEAGNVTLEGTGQGRLRRDGRSGAGRPIEAPYLQLVLERLWEKETDPGSLRLATLERLGGAEAIVRRHLDDALEKVSEKDRPVAADALRYLVTASGTKIALSAADLASYTGRADVEPVLEELTRPPIRILRAVPAPAGRGPSRYEIFHDVLGPAVLDWRSRYVREQERLELQRRSAAEQERLEHEKREAEERERAERRRARTFRALAGIAFVLLLVASALLAYAIIQRRDADHARGVSDAEARAAEAESALSDGRLETAIPLALDAYDHARTAIPVRNALLDAVQQSAGLRHLLRFDFPVEGAAIDPRSKVVLAAAGRALVLRTLSGAPVQRVRVPDLVLGVAFSSDGQLVAAGRADGKVALFRVRRSRLDAAVGLGPLPALATEQLVAKSVSFSPDGRWLAAGTDGGVVVWRLQRGAVRRRIRLGTGGDFVRDVTFCSGKSGKSGGIAAALSSGRVVFWRGLVPPIRARALGRTGATAVAVACSPDGATLAAGGSDKLVTLFSLHGRRKPEILAGHTGTIDALAFRRDGRLLASGSYDHSAILWDVPERLELALPLHAHTQPVAAVAFGARGGTLAAASWDGRISVWDVGEVLRARGWLQVAKHLRDAAFGGRVFAAVTSSDEALVRRASRPDLPGPVRPSRSSATSVAVDPGGRWLALGFDDDVRLFRLGGATPTLQTLGERAGVQSVAIARDGTLAAALPDGRIRVWQARKRSRPLNLRPPGHPAAGRESSAVAVGVGFVAAAYGNRVVLWRLGHRTQASLLRGVRGGVEDLEFDQSGRLLAAAANSVAVWDLEKGGAPVVLPTGPATAVAFSPESRLLASSGRDGRVRLWDVGTYVQRGKPFPARTDVVALGFAGPSKLAAAYYDGTAAVWELSRSQIETSFDAIRRALLRAIGRKQQAS